MKKVPGILIRVGLVLLIYGFFKDTTVETSFGAVHNIGLMRQSQNLMLFGAALFIGGLVMRSSTKDEKEERDSDEAVEKTEAEIKGDSEGVVQIQAVLSAFDAKLVAISHGLNSFRDRFVCRFICGFFAGILLFFMLVFLLPWLGVLMSGVFVILAMRKLPAAVALRKVYFVAMLLSLPQFAIGLLSVFDSGVGAAVFTFVPISLLFLGWLYFKRQAKI